jgi:hypothetical protein
MVVVRLTMRLLTHTTRVTALLSPLASVVRNRKSTTSIVEIGGSPTIVGVD